jgi:seryl-tRNA synthetase
MLAGERPCTREAAAKNAGAEKKIIGLESERNVMKQMLTTTQRERDELMKEVHRLHSQGKRNKCSSTVIIRHIYGF